MTEHCHFQISKRPDSTNSTLLMLSNDSAFDNSIPFPKMEILLENWGASTQRQRQVFCNDNFSLSLENRSLFGNSRAPVIQIPNQPIFLGYRFTWEWQWPEMFLISQRGILHWSFSLTFEVLCSHPTKPNTYKPCLGFPYPLNDSAIFSFVSPTVLIATPANTVINESKSFSKMKKIVFKRSKSTVSNTSNAIDWTTTNLETSFTYYQTYIYMLPKSGGNS